MSSAFKEKDLFVEFLQEAGLEVKDGMVRLEDSTKVANLYHDFLISRAKENGLPAAIAGQADVVAEVIIWHMDRNNQDYEKHHVTLLNDEKNYDDDTWNATAKGKVRDLWNFFIEECDSDPDMVEEAIRVSLDGGDGTVYG